MAIDLFFVYFLAIHIVLLSYYIFTLIFNQSKQQIINIKADGIRVLERLKKETQDNFSVDIVSPKYADTDSLTLYRTVLVVNSNYANQPYIENICNIAFSYLAANNNWIKNEIFIKNYLVLCYYFSLIFILLYLLSNDVIWGSIAIMFVLAYTLILLIDISVRSIHSGFVIKVLLKLKLIDVYEESYAIKSASLWNIKNLNIYYKLVSDIGDFFRRKK